jgi:hypothetical protein
MKVNELLSETEIDEVLGAAFKGLWNAGASLMRGSRAAPGIRQAVKITKPIGKQQALRQATGQFNRSMLNKLGVSPNSWLGKARIESIAASLQRKGLKKFHNDVANNMAVATDTQNKFADLGMRIFTGGMFLYGLNDYLQARSALDENDPNYQEKLHQLNGEFITSFIVPKILGAGLKWTSAGISKLIKMTGNPRAAEMARRWGGHVARVGEAAALTFLQTDKGRKWLTDLMGEAMGIIGAGAEMLIDLGKTVANSVGDLVTGKAFQMPNFGDAYAGTKHAGSVTKTFEPTK